MRPGKFPIWLVCLLLALTVTPAWAAKGGKGGKGRANNNDDPDAGRLKWHATAADAVTAARRNLLPVMAVVVREGNPDDQKRIKSIESWPQVVDASENLMAAVQVPSGSPEGRELTERLKLKNLPVIVWMDCDGNPVLASMITDSPQTILAVLNGWAQTMAGIGKYYGDHLLKGNQYLAKGKLRSAYLEYSYLAPFKGKDPDLARQGMEKVRTSWSKLLGQAKQMPEGSAHREAIIKGLRRDALYLDYAPKLEEELLKAPELAKDIAPAETLAPAGQLAPVVPPPPAQEVMPAVTTKPLVDAMRVQVVNSAYASDQAEDGSINLSYLTGHKDVALQDAGKALQEAFDTYKKAIVGTKDLGAERNKLLQSAAACFDKGIFALDKAIEKTPDPQIEKIMQQASMILYACLKYQSL